MINFSNEYSHPAGHQTCDFTLTSITEKSTETDPWSCFIRQQPQDSQKVPSNCIQMKKMQHQWCVRQSDFDIKQYSLGPKSSKQHWIRRGGRQVGKAFSFSILTQDASLFSILSFWCTVRNATLQYTFTSNNMYYKHKLPYRST